MRQELATILPALGAAALLAGWVPAALGNDQAQNSPVANPEAAAAQTELKPAEATSVAAATVKSGDSQPDSSLVKELEEEWVCRRETPTGSRRSVKVCRKKADIEANSAEVEKVMARQRHYGNPSVTPQN